MGQETEQIFGEDHSWEDGGRSMLVGLMNSKETKSSVAKPSEQEVKADDKGSGRSYMTGQHVGHCKELSMWSEGGKGAPGGLCTVA